jgi:hypothetical protein
MIFHAEIDGIWVDMEDLFLYIKLTLRRVLFSGRLQVDIQG